MALKQLVYMAKAPEIRALARNPAVAVGALFAAHVPLVLLMTKFSDLAVAHGWLTLAAGLLVALNKRRPERVAYVCAYIAGSEVLWRLSRANLFWEFGKYAVDAVILVTLIEHVRWKLNGTALLYFSLLLPSAALTILSRIPNLEIREALSFNLSGPFTLTLSVCFFSNLRLTPAQLRCIFVFFMAPIVGLAAYTSIATFTNSTIEFNTESNFAATGGFSPNQVASVLGLAAFMAFFYLVSGRRNVPRLLLLVTATGFMVQAAMTFSRSGLYLMAGAAAAASFFLARKPRPRAMLVQMSIVFLLLAIFVIVPRLNEFTSGNLVMRFMELDLSGRGDLLTQDIEYWIANPVFGIGPGVGYADRGREAHTESSRMLAEHGLFGLVALCVLLCLGIQSFTRSGPIEARALKSSATIWGFLFMLVNGMRIVAPAFMIGLATTTLMTEVNVRHHLSTEQREAIELANP